MIGEPCSAAAPAADENVVHVAVLEGADDAWDVERGDGLVAVAGVGGRLRQALGGGEAELALDQGDVGVVVVVHAEAELESACVEELAQRLQRWCVATRLPARDGGLGVPEAAGELVLREPGAPARLDDQVPRHHAGHYGVSGIDLPVTLALLAVGHALAAGGWLSWRRLGQAAGGAAHA